MSNDWPLPGTWNDLPIRSVLLFRRVPLCPSHLDVDEAE